MEKEMKRKIIENKKNRKDEEKKRKERKLNESK